MNVVRRLSPENVEIRIDPAFGVRDALLQRDAILPSELRARETCIKQIGRIFTGAVGDDFGEITELQAGLVTHEGDQVADGNGAPRREMEDLTRLAA